MNRLNLTALLGLSALLTACPQPAPPSALSDAVVVAGPALSATYQASFQGSWLISGLPAWLTASPSSGSGDVKTTFRINRSAGAPHTADQVRLSTPVKLGWQTPAGAAGSATLTVSADLYHLSGQVSVAAALGQALPTPAPLRVNAQPGPQPSAQGIIVKYKTDAAFAAALRGNGFSGTGLFRAQSLGLNSYSGRTLVVQPQFLQSRTPQSQILQAQNVQAQAQAQATALTALRADPNVEYAVPNAVLRAQNLPTQPGSGQALDVQAPYAPADQYAPLQYAYRLMGYGAVWRDMKTTPYLKPVTVAVIDTGVRFDHPDLAGRLWKSSEGALDLVTSDTFGPDTDPTDPGEAGVDGSHGTHVSGIIVAGEGTFASPCAGCSESGVVGAALTAPIKVLPVRAIDRFGNASESDVALAVNYAAGQPVTVQGVTYTNPHPAQVINLSLGGPISVAEAQPLCDAIADATQRGSLVVVAAGNGGGTQPYYPAACAGAVSVASVRPDVGGLPLHAEYSQSYPQVALAAYGGADPSNPTFNMNLMLGGKPVSDSVFSTSWDYQKNQPTYQFESGTSQATPQVSALVALLLSKGVVSTPAAALQRIEATATDLGVPGRDNDTGFGVINAAAALGAPAVSNVFTLSILGEASTFTPPLDNAGRFNAYLPDGAFQVLAGFDRSGNGLGGEVGEPGAKATVTLGPDQTAVDVGTLNVGP
ncbi:S8 family serine peptidase [Deinococcus rubellus]|uniref:S8 family serine peptidase n=1 Tax=Deinococcus rubellus TaxID=1889240 RepID=A0ABY5YKI2_9DEIO|nr:S8 family serine peptidase [Deinococcus rubellus]UWX64602.1 S8 family serine peptidase [Deinococcus rubellus]